MRRLRAALAATLALSLILSSTPVHALARASAATPRASAAVPALPAPRIQSPSAIAIAEPHGALQPLALAQLEAAQAADPRSAEASAGVAFDGGARRNAGSFGAVPFAAALPLAIKVPSLGVASYVAANALSVAFPIPQVYRTYAQGHARDFPATRAALGAAGTIALGMINAPMLDMPFWGAMHIFIGLGMLAPYFVGKRLERKGAGERRWLAPERAKTRLAKAWARARGDGAALRTALVALPLLAASAGLYAVSAAAVPEALSTVMRPRAIESLLLGLQLFKAALFMAVFAPDIVALVKGRPPKGFTMGLNMVFLASAVSFAAWGFSAAAATPAGPIRDQYLVLALRNLGESTAAGLSVAAILRARRAAKPK